MENIKVIKAHALITYGKYGILDALKYIKTETGFGLKESKDCIDKWVAESLGDTEEQVLIAKNKQLATALRNIISINGAGYKRTQRAKFIADLQPFIEEAKEILRTSTI